MRMMTETRRYKSVVEWKVEKRWKEQLALRLYQVIQILTCEYVITGRVNQFDLVTLTEKSVFVKSFQNAPVPKKLILLLSVP